MSTPISSSSIPADPLEQLHAEREILQLLARFDVATITRDTETFRTLWEPDGVWVIGEPIPMRAEGIEAILQALQRFNTANEFFFRTTSLPVITLQGERATVRVPTTELARREGTHVYSNAALYEDVLARREGQWRFVSRTYQYVWVDTNSTLPGIVVSLPNLSNPQENLRDV